MHPDFPEHLIKAGDSKIIYGEDTFGSSEVGTDGYDQKDDSGKKPSSPPAPEHSEVPVKAEITSSDQGISLSGSDEGSVKQFMELFDISEVRAVNLYKAGYKKPDDFKDAETSDLVTVEKINPTVARHIIEKMKDVES
jgi:hypothetical protein